MIVTRLHKWNVTTQEARGIQHDLVVKLTFPSLKKESTFIARADISFSKQDPRLYGAVVLMKFPECEIFQIHTGQMLASFPYIPGFLFFREFPLIVKLFEKLKHIPDVGICDG